MDIEQLKLILEAARAAGDGAMTIVITWFFFLFFEVLAKWSLGAGLIYAAYKTVQRMVSSFAFKERVDTVLNGGLYDSRCVENFINWLRHVEKPEFMYSHRKKD